MIWLSRSSLASVMVIRCSTRRKTGTEEDQLASEVEQNFVLLTLRTSKGMIYWVTYLRDGNGRPQSSELQLHLSNLLREQLGLLNLVGELSVT